MCEEMQCGRQFWKYINSLLWLQIIVNKGWVILWFVSHLKLLFVSIAVANILVPILICGVYSSWKEFVFKAPMNINMITYCMWYLCIICWIAYFMFVSGDWRVAFIDTWFNSVKIWSYIFRSHLSYWFHIPNFRILISSSRQASLEEENEVCLQLPHENYVHSIQGAFQAMCLWLNTKLLVEIASFNVYFFQFWRKLWQDHLR